MNNAIETTGQQGTNGNTWEKRFEALTGESGIATGRAMVKELTALDEGDTAVAIAARNAGSMLDEAIYASKKMHAEVTGMRALMHDHVGRIGPATHGTENFVAFARSLEDATTKHMFARRNLLDALRLLDAVIAGIAKR